MNGSSNEQMDEQMDNVIICEKHSFSDIQYGKVKQLWNIMTCLWKLMDEMM